MTKTVDVGIQLLHPDARVPEKAHPTDACYDVWAVGMEYLDDPNIIGCRIKYDLGFALDVPLDHEVILRPRSNINKHGLILANSPGTGDESHITSYSVIFNHLLHHLKPYESGDRVAQMRCIGREDNNYFIVDFIAPKERGYSEGYGSSGLKELPSKSQTNMPYDTGFNAYDIWVGDSFEPLK